MNLHGFLLDGYQVFEIYYRRNYAFDQFLPGKSIITTFTLSSLIMSNVKFDDLVRTHAAILTV
jgi:hypothetical protein